MIDTELPASTRPLILASTSRYRAELLRRLGVPFSVANPETEEAEIPGEPPRDRAGRLASLKAAVVAARHPGAIVVGSDQVAAASSTLLRKPGNAANCREQLKLLSGTRADFFTGCHVRCDASGLAETHIDTTAVRVRPLDDREIERYIEREQPFDCAGGFKAEGLGIALFESIDSEDPSALIGMPLIWLAAALRRAGYRVP